MSSTVPTLFVSKVSKTASYVLFAEFDFQLRFADFVSYTQNENVSAEIEIPDIDAVCAVNIIPQFLPLHSCNYYTYVTITLKGLKKEFQTPEKYQVQFKCLAGGVDLFTSNPQNITSDVVQFCKQYPRETFTKALLSDGSLLLNVKVSLKIRNSAPDNVVHNPMVYSKNIANNIFSMFKDPQFSDFKFIVRGKEFKVHRAILAAASPVFVKIFTTDMKEARKNECVVNDIEPEIFEHLLRFIYGGKLPDDVTAVSVKLFEAAHYYEVQPLKDICKQYFPSLLNVENALELYNWAIVYDFEELKMQAWDIIKNKILKIYLPLENEPLPPQEIQNIIKQKQSESEFWNKLVKQQPKNDPK